MCFLRHLDEKAGFEMLDQASAHKEKIIGVGLDSSEIGNPDVRFHYLIVLNSEYNQN